MKTVEVLMNLKIVNECECDSVLVSRFPILGLCFTLNCDFLNCLAGLILCPAGMMKVCVSRLN